MAAQGPGQGAEQLRVLLRVVDPSHQAVLQRDPPACILKIVSAGHRQLLDGVPPGHRHQLLALLVRGRVQGQRQRDLQSLPGQPPYLRHQAAGGNRDASLADMKPPVICEHPDKFHQILVIIQGFPRAHDHHIAHPLSREQGDGIDLIQHLRRLQIPDQPSQGGGAECTSHPAAHLRGNTDAVAVPVLHPHTLHQIPVPQFKKELLRAVQPGLLYPHRSQGRVGKTGPPFLPKLFGQVVHVLKAPGQFHMHPLVNLPGPEGLLPPGGQILFQFLQGEGFYIRPRRIFHFL